MLRTLDIQRVNTPALRVAAIAFFTLLTAISAKMSFEVGAVPFTMQVLVVLLAGMVLGSRDGAASQIAYLSMIAANFPVDARGLGAAAFASPTSGYLLGFVIAAFVAGYLVEHSGGRLWQRWSAGIAGIAVLYLCGMTVLKLVAGLDWLAAWNAGVAPFVVMDLVKALLAASMVETGRSLLLHQGKR